MMRKRLCRLSMKFGSCKIEVHGNELKEGDVFRCKTAYSFAQLIRSTPKMVVYHTVDSLENYVHHYSKLKGREIY
jgi:hypothetical protein